MENKISAITAFAATAHEGQMRKYANEPYINHPVRVMQLCFAYEKKISVIAAALLHDVLEDTAVTELELFTFLHKTLMPEDADHSFRLVTDLTDVFTKTAYPLMNKVQRKMNEHERLQKILADAQTIKYADIIDNSRDKAVPQNENALKLLKDYQHLLAKIPSGNRGLYELAQTTVNDCIIIVQHKTFYSSEK